jgi:hypothetical protein
MTTTTTMTTTTAAASVGSNVGMDAAAPLCQGPTTQGTRSGRQCQCGHQCLATTASGCHGENSRADVIVLAVRRCNESGWQKAQRERLEQGAVHHNHNHPKTTMSGCGCCTAATADIDGCRQQHTLLTKRMLRERNSLSATSAPPCEAQGQLMTKDNGGPHGPLLFLLGSCLLLLMQLTLH